MTWSLLNITSMWPLEGQSLEMSSSAAALPGVTLYLETKELTETITKYSGRGRGGMKDGR